MSDHYISMDEDGASLRRLPNYPLVTQTAHGFVAGDLVRNGTGTWVKGTASTPETVPTHVVARVISANAFSPVAYEPSLELTAHGFASGALLYASDTAGEIATSAGTNSHTVGTVLDANRICFTIAPFFREAGQSSAPIEIDQLITIKKIDPNWGTTHLGNCARFSSSVGGEYSTGVFEFGYFTKEPNINFFYLLIDGNGTTPNKGVRIVRTSDDVILIDFTINDLLGSNAYDGTMFSRMDISSIADGTDFYIRVYDEDTGGAWAWLAVHPYSWHFGAV